MQTTHSLRKEHTILVVRTSPSKHWLANQILLTYFVEMEFRILEKLHLVAQML